MLGGVLLDHLVFRGVIEGLPELNGSGGLIGAFGHLGGHYLEPWMSMRDLRSPVKCIGCSLVIFPVKVMNKSQSKVEPPVIRVGTDTFFNQGHGFIRLSGACGRRLREE